MNIINSSDLPEILHQAYDDGCYDSSIDINQYGIWKIYGPDGEYEGTSLLSIAEGTFINVLAYAVTISEFQEFGEEFGHLEEYKIPDTFKVNDSYFKSVVNQDKIKNLENLRKEKEELEQRLSDIIKKIDAFP